MPVKFHLRYTGIRVRNLDASILFYRDVLGMELVWRGPIESTHGEVATLRTPGTAHLLELNHYTADGRMGPPYREGDELDHLAFGVDDLFHAVDELRAKGATVKVEPPGGGRIPCAFVLDPNGIWVELISGGSGIGPGSAESGPRTVR
ncbi:MAG: VOC family protein [Thermoplasmata archaeon]|nr:VOC family protein [Thermoplasmata archaeon]